ncbi:uncharacterized protein C7orf57 homolog [Physella acuta]|uniref:uncharacterized protein C7orf57 homolog n=1 Tax=Physella acuta TaxID=109671 RepID=UPI0027DB5702|nr:uncharacterized protein C7orf57 homolog [Physella acuta]
MPVSQNPKECGWFYHAPAKKQIGPKVDYPAPSNIPGLGFDDPASTQRPEVREMVFRETDSKYIRMAKMGGRKDLLSFKPITNHKVSDGPVGYPRNDWFYLEDNRLEDETEKPKQQQQWEFLLPEYMVHKSYKPSFEDPEVRPTRSAAPYHTEVNSVIEEGRAATDKTVRIPELRKQGYGVRNEKPARPAQKPPVREKPVKPQESENWQGQQERKSKPQMLVPSEKEEPTSMSKLLSGDYERQWYSKLSELQHQEPQAQPRAADSERQAGTSQTKTASATHRRARSDIHPNSAQKTKTHEDEDKELFKLSRFKNVSSKVDTYQRPELLTAAN